MSEYDDEIHAYAKKLNWDYKPASWKDVAENLEQENQRISIELSNEKLQHQRDLEAWEDKHRPVKQENQRLLVLAAKHCPAYHSDFEELKAIAQNKG